MSSQLLIGKKIWVYKSPIDFRKQINGLVELITESKISRPNDGSIYVFRNRDKNKIKLLMWHINGFFLGYKRLEKGRFDFDISEDRVQLSSSQLLQLLSGIPMIYMGKESEKKTIFS